MNQEEIYKLIQKSDVVIFGEGEKGEPDNGPTALVQEIFDELAPDYVMVNIQDDKESWAELLSDFTDDWPDFPVVFIHGELAGGSDDVCKLEEEGELDEILAVK